MERNIRSTEEAFSLLKELKAPVQLILHAELVSEAAEEMIEKLSTLGISLDYDFIRFSVILHDTGKIIHVSELSRPGHCHEEEGERILVELGIDPKIARCSLSHARYTKMSCSIEELIVALSDNLWKGKRDEILELMVIDDVAKQLGKERWNMYVELDECFENIAMKGNERLSRSCNSF
ncbi:MAG: HD domain-containing protein [Clostridia bacterium]|nr:HD domain-containing protein [Clostridia bacterium]